MTAKRQRSEPGPAFSINPDDHRQLSVEMRTSQPVEQASLIMKTDERLRRLLTASRSIVRELSLPAVLGRLVETARDVAGAQYAALGVIGTDGLLEQFLHVGMDGEAVRAIGELPKGRGVLGILIQDPKTIRLTQIADDPRSLGFPDGHPPMSSFLGVPIRSRDSVFGYLYLTNRTDGGPFTSEDEDLVVALAVTAGIAIENALLYEESRRRQEWLRASGEISRQLLDPETEYPETLHRIATSVRRLAAADVVTLVEPTDDDPRQLEVVVAAGAAERELVGLRYQKRDSIAWQAMQQGHGVRLERIDQKPTVSLHLRPSVPVSQAMALPLRGETGPRGAIVAGRIMPHAAFTEADLDMAETFAGQAAIALELSDARANQQRLDVLQDRDRIATDLHDHVIQRLFAAGLGLQSVASTANDEVLAQRLTRTVDELDETIRQIRTTIYAMQDDLPPSLDGALEVVDQIAPLP